MNGPLWILVIVGVLVLLDALVHLFYALLTLERFERKPPFRPPSPPDEAIDHLPFSVLVDGFELVGGIYASKTPAPSGVVIFTPETDASFPSALCYVEALLQAGFAVVAFDFRNQGQSESDPTYRPLHWFTEHDVRDLRAVIAEVQNNPQLAGLPIGLCGVSRGANVALYVATETDAVRGVWVQGAFTTRQLAFYHGKKALRIIMGWTHRLVPDWHIRLTIRLLIRFSQKRTGSPYRHLEHVLPLQKHQKLAITCGGKDGYVPPQIVQQLAALCHKPASDVWVVENAKHNQERIVAGEEYDQKIVQFFQSCLCTAPLPAIH